LRYVKELEREQDKINACDAEIVRLRDEAEAARQDGRAKLEALVAAKEAALSTPTPSP
jgi:hypothetical protein